MDYGTHLLVPTVAAGSTAHEMTVLLLSLAALLGLARLLGETVRRLGQPAILGELLAGIVLGPTVLGYMSPDVYHWLFPQDPDSAAYITLRGLVTLSAIFLLLVAGLEVELSVAFRQGKAALLVAMLGMALPFTMGFGAAWLAPSVLGGPGATHHPLAFAVFAGIALSITALPVIAKILIDLNIFKADLGMLIMGAAILNDVAGWMGFAVVMAMIGPVDAASGNVAITLLLTIGSITALLTVGRVVIHRCLPFIQAYGSWPGSVIGFVLVVTLLCAAATEAIGIHAIFGAFLAGVAIGDSSHLRIRTRETIEEFITNIFAPIFFASIGLYVNFLTAFNIVPVLIAVVIAFTGKMLGCYIAGKLANLQTRESLAVGFGMVAQGTMGVILGQLALDQQLITEQLFVAIVVVALLTSIVSGPGMKLAMQRKQVRRLGDLLSERRWVPWIKAHDAKQAIRELTAVAADVANLDHDQTCKAVWRREKVMATGLGQSIAVPHAQLADLDTPVVVVGRSQSGVDFNAPDGEPARIICLLLTPVSDQTVQVELLRMVAEAFSDGDSLSKAMAATSFTQFLAAIKLPGEGRKP